ncbi:unnamed protein product, partial [Rotaria magnacalcarata]
LHESRASTKPATDQPVERTKPDSQESRAPTKADSHESRAPTKADSYESRAPTKAASNPPGGGSKDYSGESVDDGICNDQIPYVDFDCMERYRVDVIVNLDVVRCVRGKGWFWIIVQTW